ncbi:YceH family protein [Pantoea sp. USHLN298]|uniref:YceH family protein n=1 Tax=Pantoea sp. USHLN298 TaxID=3081294 RepID=UPI003019C8F4
MKLTLSAQALRVLGCLLEKQVTTPEQYPLSLNGVVSACNQKSNREPVMNLSETEVQDQLDQLEKRHLVTVSSGSGQRVMKYEQRFCNSAFGALKLSSAEVAVLTLLLLRGAQTPGELRTRSGRLHEFSDVSEVEQTLDALLQREDSARVMRLAREPGKREHRFIHLLSDDAEVPEPISGADQDDLSTRVAALEHQVAQLQAQLTQLLQPES